MHVFTAVIFKSEKVGTNLNVHKKVNNGVNHPINYVIHFARIMASDKWFGHDQKPLDAAQ